MQAMSAAEFRDWQRFDQVEPFGERRANIHAALICQQIVNMLRSRDSRPVTYEAFMLMSPEEAAQPGIQRVAQFFRTMGMQSAAVRPKGKGKGRKRKRHNP